MDVWAYYGPGDSRFAIVEQSGDLARHEGDSKIASARKLLTSGMPPREVAKNLGVSIPTLYRWVPASALP
jgi:DNA invertase Pin-like site-specific DNA recombinase